VVEVALVLLGVAAVASISGYAGSAVQRRRQQRAGRVFAVGFFCGALVSTISRATRQRLASSRSRLLGTSLRGSR
jgi:hypothetical protein